MKEIVYTEHLKLRLKIRKIPEHYPKEIYKNPEQKFFDNVEGNFIAIKKLEYNNKIRNVMIAYEQKEGKIEIVTIHPITDEKIINRVVSRRWTK
ncbi:MAG: hypothetical protein HYW23_01180 [Candidatus Aenigmarchaeota archaeon]|nr:hypothetical protein [Candidatus Aenigmarchaeota archaeon]